MRLKIALLAFGLSVLALPASTPAFAQSNVCARLEAQLAATQQRAASPAQIRRYEDALGRQQYELDRTIGMARGMGCGRRSLFGPPQPPQCRDLDRRIARMESNMDQLIGQLQRARGSGGNQDARRQQILAALAQNRCGAAQQQPQQGGLFGLLFGRRDGQPAPGQQQQQLIAPPEVETPRMSGMRNVCVRKCDGYFFPVSYSAGQGRAASDESVCKRTCPGADAELFSFPNSGSIAEATSSHGQPYSNMPNAFRYQKEFVADCSCKPQNMTWAEAVGENDASLRKGDIVVDEKRARQLSQPKANDARSATPEEAARASREAAQESAEDVVIEEVQEGAEAEPVEEPAPNIRSVGPTFFPE